MLEDLLVALKQKKNFSILYVEDEAMIRKPMQNLMQRLCKDVISASDGAEALEIYQRQVFNIVITDLHMPNMNGVELIKNIRRINPNQIIIVITAYRDGPELKEAEEYGIDYIITKPLSFSTFVSVMKDIVK